MIATTSSTHSIMTKRTKSCGACSDCAVRSMAVCAALPDAEIGEFERIMSSQSLRANELLVEEGDEKKKVFTLTSGMLRLFSMLPDGRRQISGFLFPGDYLGLADDDTYSQSAEAVIPSVLCAFSVADMEDAMERFPSLILRLHEMTRHALRQSRENQMVLGRLAPVEKLASFLLLLSHNAKKRGEPDNPVHLDMSRTDIADYLGLTIETVSRSFTKLRTQGLIQLIDTNTVEIQSMRSLAAVAGLDIFNKI